MPHVCTNVLICLCSSHLHTPVHTSGHVQTRPLLHIHPPVSLFIPVGSSDGRCLLLPSPQLHTLRSYVRSCLPVPTLNLLRICLHLSLPASACPHLGIPNPLPQAWGSQGDSHDAAQSPDVRLAGMSVSGHYLWSQEVWGPAEHSGGITGAQEDWEPPPRPDPPAPTQRARSELAVTCGSGPLAPSWWPAPGLRSSPPCSCSRRSYLMKGNAVGGEEGAWLEWKPHPHPAPKPRPGPVLSFRSRWTMRRWCR